MTKDEMNKIAEALRDQGLTLGQTMFAVSLVLEAIHTEREACASICEELKYDGYEMVKDNPVLAKKIRARGEA